MIYQYKYLPLNSNASLKLLFLASPFSHLQNKDNNSTNIIKLLKSSKEIIYGKYLTLIV